MAGISQLVSAHNQYRRSGINLIASENRLLPEALSALGSDLAGRYHNIHYGGSKYAIEIIERTEGLIKELFGVPKATALPLAGNMCDMAAFFGNTGPGDGFMFVQMDAGGYPFGAQKFGRRKVAIPCTGFDVDLDRFAEVFDSEKPALVMLGASEIRFPHPVREVRKIIGDIPLVFDGSHVMGLLLMGHFQKPFDEGADMIFGSTHKSLPGPQGGLMAGLNEVFDRSYAYLDFDLDGGLALVDNPHVNRIAALGITLEALKERPDYPGRIVAIGKRLGKILDDGGIPVMDRKRGYTESHQLALKLSWDDAAAFSRKCEEVGLFLDRIGRIGTAEAAWIGLTDDEVDVIGEILVEVWKDGPQEEMRARVKVIAEAHPVHVPSI